MVLWLGEGDAYALLGELLRAEYGLGVLPAMARGADGKPYFPGEPELHFNVSHSGGLALCGAGRPPGVLRPRRPGLERYVWPTESAWLEWQGGDWGAFYTLWTLKEARVKCTGEGLRRPPRDIAVPLLRPGETGELDGLAFSAFFGETWRAAACCPTPQGPLELFVRNS
ncbi:MAG: 4'-phosphopantetheinyl transferase family protein [Flavonifractor plautii]